MIGIIGIKRVFVLIVLAVMNACLAAGIYLYAMPESERTESDIRRLRGQSTAVQTDIDRMQLEFEQLGKQQDKFDQLKAAGFFSLQDRSIAKDLMKTIQEQSRVISAVANIKAGYVESDAEAEKTNHSMLVSPVELELKAFDDTDIYRYLEIAQRKFPGMLTIERLDIRRIKDVNAPVLRAIAAGANPQLVQAQVYLFWTTMVPKSVLENVGGGNNAN